MKYWIIGLLLFSWSVKADIRPECPKNILLKFSSVSFKENLNESPCAVGLKPNQVVDFSFKGKLLSDTEWEFDGSSLHKTCAYNDEETKNQVLIRITGERSFGSLINMTLVHTQKIKHNSKFSILETVIPIKKLTTREIIPSKSFFGPTGLIYCRDQNDWSHAEIIGDVKNVTDLSTK